MDEFKLVVEYTGMYEWMNICFANPFKQVTHKFWNTSRRWCHVQTITITVEHAHTLLPVVTGIANQLFHHQFMGFQQILFFKSIQLRHEAIGFDGVFHLLYFIGSTQHVLAVNNICYLFQ